MSGFSNLDSFLSTFRRDLHRRRWLAPSRRARIFEEARDHLNCSVEALIAAGMPAPEAEGEAIRRFGSSSDLARNCELVQSVQEGGFEDMLKIAVGLLAAMTALMAGANLAFALILNPQGSVGWIAVRALASIFVLILGLTTLGTLFSGRQWPSWVSTGTMVLLLLGLITTARASYFALFGPDPEYWAVMLGMFLVAQALGTLLLLRREPSMA